MSQGGAVNPELLKLSEKIQGLLRELRETESKKTRQIQSRHQLSTQKSENELVKEELDHLEDGASVYKLIGPALIAQDLSDAKSIVSKRLEYIGKELQRTDEAIDGYEKQEETFRAGILEVQQKVQQMQQQLQQQQQAA